MARVVVDVMVPIRWYALSRDTTLRYDFNLGDHFVILRGTPGPDFCEVHSDVRAVERAGVFWLGSIRSVEWGMRTYETLALKCRTLVETFPGVIQDGVVHALYDEQELVSERNLLCALVYTDVNVQVPWRASCPEGFFQVPLPWGFKSQQMLPIATRYEREWVI